MNPRTYVRPAVLSMVLTLAVAPMAPLARAAGTQPGTIEQQQAAESTLAPVTLKLSVVISRVNGEKKIANLPFAVMVLPSMAAGRMGEATSLQTGAEVPVSTTTMSAGKEPVASYQYRSVGTHLSVQAGNAGNGQFTIQLTVSDSQIMSDPPDAAIRLPRFGSFTSQNRLLLRDGQSVQYVAASDKISGDVIRLDVTMNVIK